MRFHRLHLNHLVTLEVLLLERSLTRAAGQLHLTQPAISNALRKLREHFGDELLVSKGRTMEPTPFARELLKPLRETLQRMRSIALAKPSFDPSTSSRDLRIVSSEYVATVFLTSFMRLIAEIAPNMTLTYIPISEESLQMFERSDADVVIAPLGDRTLPNHPRCELFSEKWVCIASRDNPLVGAKLTAEQYKELPRVVPPFKNYVVDRALDLTAAGRSISMPFSAIPWLVARTNYISVIPERLASMYEGMLPLKRVAMGGERRLKFVVQWHEDTMENAFERWLLEQLRKVGAGLEAGTQPITEFMTASGTEPERDTRKRKENSAAAAQYSSGAINSKRRQSRASISRGYPQLHAK